MKNFKLTYPLELLIDPLDPNGSIGVRVVGLEGCFSQGDTVDEAILNAQEAIEGWIQVAKESKQQIPAPPKVVQVKIVRPRDGWLTVGKAAKQIGVTAATLRKIVSRGELSAYKFGHEIRIREVDMDLFMAQSKLPLAA